MNRRTLGGAFWLTATQVTQRGGAFLLAILAARFLAEEGFGRFSVLWTVMGLAFVAAEWGQQVWVTRALGRESGPPEAVLGRSLGVVIRRSLMAFAVYILVVPLFVKGTTSASFWIGGALVLNALGHAGRGALRAKDAWREEFLAMAAERSAMLALSAAALALGGGLAMLAACIFLGQLLGLSAVLRALRGAGFRLKAVRESLGIPARKSGTKNDADAFGEYGKAGRDGFWLMLSSFAAVAYVRGDILMLSLFRDSATVGAYAAAANIVLVFGFLPQVVLWAVFPELSGRRDELDGRWLLRAWKGLGIAGILGAALLTVFSRPLFAWVYGDTFEGASRLPVLAVGESINFLNYAGGVFFWSVDRERRLAKIMLGGAAFNIFANFLAIPAFGADGAAWTTAITYLLVAVGYARATPGARQTGPRLAVGLAVVSALVSLVGAAP